MLRAALISARAPNQVLDQGLVASAVLEEVEVLNAQGQVALEAKNRVVALEVQVEAVVVSGVLDPVVVALEAQEVLGEPEEISEVKVNLVTLSVQDPVILEEQGAVLKQLEATPATSMKNCQVLEERNRLKVMNSMDTRDDSLCDLYFSYIKR